MRSMLWRRPIKIIEKDIDGVELEFNNAEVCLPLGREPTNLIQFIWKYSKSLKTTQNHPKPSKTMQNQQRVR